MKNRKNTKTLIAAFLALFIFAACGQENKENGLDIESGKIGTATITLENGKEIEFVATLSTVQSTMGKTIGLSNPKNGLLMIFSIISFTGEGEYTTNTSIITLKQQAYDDLLKEEYRSNYYKSPEGETGNSKITLTEVSESHIAGTFSGVLYSESGKKAIISNGEFDFEID